MVIWLIGMSASGKTAVGRALFEMLKPSRPETVMIDGDSFRRIMGDDLGHSLEERRRNADRMCRMCQFLEEQGLLVICAILSLFPESRSWNRENYHQYLEVYLKVDFEELLRRDPKGLYRKALAGELKDFVGVDIEFPAPQKPDLVIHNQDDVSPRSAAAQIIQALDTLPGFEAAKPAPSPGDV